MKLLIVPEVAEIIRTSPDQVYSLVRQGILPGMKIGRRVVISEDALQKWIEQGGQAWPGNWRKNA
jgi:excisionase family DNA binding protein